MKIGIITFWQTKDNYGQMLQCFALQQKLIEIGHSPFLIRYTHSEVKFTNWKQEIKHFLKSLLKTRKQTNKEPKDTVSDDYRQFDYFKNHYLKNSVDIYHSIKELRKNPPKANVYITGSDQVWAKYLGFEENKTFFLDFGDKKIKRISYAASFAMPDYPTKTKAVLKRMLSHFNAISVRELSGIDICKSVGFNARLVLDPTLLLKKDDYLKIFNLTDKNKKGIYIYSLNIADPSEMHWEEIKEYANTHNMQILITPSSGYISGSEIFGKQNYEYSSIPQWLNNINDSELVVTTSFHGVVFCILFHTNFIYVPLQGKYAKGNNRVLDLLENLDIKGKSLTDKDTLSGILFQPIDWEKVEQKLSSLRDESIEFITTNIQ